MSITGSGTTADLLADARARRHEVTERLVHDWVGKGLLDRSGRGGPGRGRGSVKGRFPVNQRLLFITLLDQRAKGARRTRTLAQVPIWIWLYFGDEYVPTRQALKALTTWLEDSRSTVGAARVSASWMLELLDHPSARPADRRALRDILTGLASRGELDDREALLRAVRRVFEPESIYHALARADGHPEVRLTAEAPVTLIEARLAAAKALKARTVTEPQMQEVRDKHLVSRADYGSRRQEFHSQASPGHRNLFTEDSTEAPIKSSAPELLTGLGFSILSTQPGHRPPGLDQALTEVTCPLSPIDGDCLVWEPRVRLALQRSGFPAVRTVATGWLDTATQVLSFQPEVTTADDHVIDFTARHFASSLPPRWITSRADYCHQLARATRCAQVTLSSD